MADNFDALQLHLTLDTSDYSKELKSTSSTSKKVLGELSAQADSFAARWQDVTHNIRSAKSVLSSMALYGFFEGLTSVIYSSAAAITQFSMNMETAEISMQYFVDGTDKAAKSLEYLREMQALAADTSFTTESAVNLSKFMSAMGLNLNVTKDVMRVINDAAAATGASEANMQRIVTSIGQILTKGRLAAEEVRQLANANIPIYEILQEEMGLTGTQIKNIGNYWYDAEESVVAILTGLQKRYDGAAEKVADTMSGMVNSIQDNALMIGSIAASGVYDDAADKILVIRDALSEYRDIAVNMGSTALLREVLLDIDPSGDVGNKVFTLVGGFRQLIGTAGDLYITCQPLVTMFGKGLYYSITTLTVGVNALGETLEATDNVLNSFGISLEDVFEIMAGVYITYKVAKTFGYVGQAAAALTMNLYNTGKAAWSLLPASITANTGLGLLTGGLLAAGGIALYFSGALDKVFDSLAGLSSSETGLPSDFEAAFAEYEAEMELYNQQIAQYEGMFDQSFSTIAENGSAAFKVVQEQAKKSAAKASDSWLASFDEVYKVPEDSDAGNTELSFPDLSALIDKLKFIFPAKIEAEFKQPEIDWGKVFNQDNEEATKAALDAWTPVMLLGVSSAFAHAFRKRFAEEAKKASTGPAPKKTVTPEEKAAEKMAAAADSMRAADDALDKAVSKLDDLVKDINKLDAHDGVTKLTASINETEKLLKEANKRRAALGEDTRTVSTITTAKAKLQTRTLDKLIDDFNIAQARRLEAEPKALANTTAYALLKQQEDKLAKQIEDLAAKLGPDNISSSALSFLGGREDTLQKTLDILNKNLDTLGAYLIDEADIYTPAVQDLITKISDNYSKLVSRIDKLGVSAQVDALLLQNAKAVQDTNSMLRKQDKLTKHRSTQLAVDADADDIRKLTKEIQALERDIKSTLNDLRVSIPGANSTGILREVNKQVDKLDARIADYITARMPDLKKAEVILETLATDDLKRTEQLTDLHAIAERLLKTSSRESAKQLSSVTYLEKHIVEALQHTAAEINTRLVVATASQTSLEDFYKLLGDTYATQFESFGMSEKTSATFAEELIKNIQKIATDTNVLSIPTYKEAINKKVIAHAVEDTLTQISFDDTLGAGQVAVLRPVVDALSVIGDELANYTGELTFDAQLVQRIMRAYEAGTLADATRSTAYIASFDTLQAAADAPKKTYTWKADMLPEHKSEAVADTFIRLLSKYDKHAAESIRLPKDADLADFIDKYFVPNLSDAENLKLHKAVISDLQRRGLRDADLLFARYLSELENIYTENIDKIFELSVTTDDLLTNILSEGADDASTRNLLKALREMRDEMRKALVAGMPRRNIADYGDEVFDDLYKRYTTSFKADMRGLTSSYDNVPAIVDDVIAYQRTVMHAVSVSSRDVASVLKEVQTTINEALQHLNEATRKSALALVRGTLDDDKPITPYYELTGDDMRAREGSAAALRERLHELSVDRILTDTDTQTIFKARGDLMDIFESSRVPDIDAGTARDVFKQRAEAYLSKLSEQGAHKGVLTEVRTEIQKIVDSSFDASGSVKKAIARNVTTKLQEATITYFDSINATISANSSGIKISTPAYTRRAVDPGRYLAEAPAGSYLLNEDLLKTFRTSGLFAKAGDLSALDIGLSRVGKTVADTLTEALTDSVRKAAGLEPAYRTVEQLVRQEIGNIFEKLSLSTMPAGKAGNFYNYHTGTAAQVDAAARVPLETNAGAWSIDTLPVEIKTTTRHSAINNLRNGLADNIKLADRLGTAADTFNNTLTDAYVLSTEQADSLFKAYDIDAWHQIGGIGVTTGKDTVVVRIVELPPEIESELLSLGRNAASPSGRSVTITADNIDSITAKISASLKEAIAQKPSWFAKSLDDFTTTIVVPVTAAMKQSTIAVADAYAQTIRTIGRITQEQSPVDLSRAITGVLGNGTALPATAHVRYTAAAGELLKASSLPHIDDTSFTDLLKRTQLYYDELVRAGTPERIAHARENLRRLEARLDELADTIEWNAVYTDDLTGRVLSSGDDARTIKLFDGLSMRTNKNAFLGEHGIYPQLKKFFKMADGMQSTQVIQLMDTSARMPNIISRLAGASPEDTKRLLSEIHAFAKSIENFPGDSTKQIADAIRVALHDNQYDDILTAIADLDLTLGDIRVYQQHTYKVLNKEHISQLIDDVHDIKTSSKIAAVQNAVAVPGSLEIFDDLSIPAARISAYDTFKDIPPAWLHTETNNTAGMHVNVETDIADNIIDDIHVDTTSFDSIVDDIADTVADAVQDSTPRASTLDELLERIRNLSMNSTWTAYFDDFMQTFGQRISVAAMGPRKAFLNLRAGGLEGFRNSLPELLKMGDFVADSGLTAALRSSLSEALVDGKLSVDDISASFFKNIDNMKGMSTTTVRKSFAAALDDLSLDSITKETLNKQVRNIIVNARYNTGAIDTMSIDSLFTKKSGRNLFAEYEKLYSNKGAAAAEEFLNAQVTAGQASVKAYDKAILQMKATQDLANKLVQEGAATNIDEAIKLASKQTGLDLKSTQKLVAISHGPTVSKKTAQEAAARYVEADKAYQEALEALADAPDDNVARLAVEAAENMRNEAAQGLGKVFDDVAGNKLLGSLMPGNLVDGSLKGMAKAAGKTLQTGVSATLRILFSDVLGVGPLDALFFGLEFASATESNKQLRGYYEDSITLQLANLNNLSIEAARNIVDAASKDTSFDSLWNQYSSTMASVGTQVAGSVIGTIAGMFVEGLITGVAVTSWSGPGAIIGGIAGGVITGIASAIAMGDGGLSLYNQYGGDIRKEILDATYIKNLEDAGYTYDQAKKYGMQQNKSAAALLAASAYDSKMAYGASIFSGFGESEIVNQLDALKEFYRYKYVAVGEDILPEYSKSGVTEFNHGAQIFSEAVDYWEKQGRAEYEKLPGEDMHASLMMLMTGAQYSLVHDALGGSQNELSEMWQELLSEVGRDSDMYAMQQTVKGIDKGVALLEALSGTTIDIYNTDAATQLAITEQLTEIYKGLSREAASDLAGIQISKLAAGSYFELGNGLVFDTLVGQTDAVTAGMIRFAESLGLTVASVEDLGLTVEGVDLSNIKTIGLAAGDIEDFRKHLAGWTVALPNTFDVGTLSTNEVSILASAGITIDATGVTFAQAQLPGQAGTERDFDYDLRNVSLREQELLDTQAGISITENTFTLDKSFIDENLRSAFYELPGEVFGNISTEAATKLAGYKEIVDTQGNVISREATNEGLGVYHADTGMFEVTNAAILRGEKTIEDWLNEYDPNGTMFSDALRNDFLLPLQKIFAEGTYAEYANAVSYDTGLVDLNSLGALTLSSMDINGASFSEYGNEGVVATVSNLSESVAEGVSKVLTKDWNALDADIKEMLKDKGVKTENRGLYTTVDISNTISGSGDELLQMYSYLPDLMNDLDAATLNYLRATGRWDEENGIYTWAQQAGSSIAYVGGEFAAFTQFLPASMQTAISDAAAISQTGFEQMAAGQVLTFEAMSLEAVNSFENTSNEIALAFDDIPNQILYDFALANGYISEEMNGVTVDTIKEVEGLRDQIAGIKISKSFADTFADADTVITEQLELVRQAIASGETPLSAEAAQLGVAVAQALKNGLEQELQNLSLTTEASAKVKLHGDDNRTDADLKATGATNSDLQNAWFPWQYDSKADKQAGEYNGIYAASYGWQAFYNGKEYRIQAASKEQALELLYYEIFKEAYVATNTKQPRLGIEGYANGGILEDDGLYRLAEQGRKEAVIPLENPTVSAHIGSAMMQMMYASAEWKKLSSLVGICDGGISTRAIERHMNVPVQEPQTSVEDMTDAILQRVLPAIVQSSNSDTGSDNKTPVYVGTLIADDNGLRELNKRMRLIEVKETRRR